MPFDQTVSQTLVVLDKFPDKALPTLYRAAIGRVSTTYYLKLFVQFEAEGRVGLSWNWAASLSTFNWLLFRKLALPLFTYLVTVVMLLVLVAGTGQLILHWTPAVEWSAWTVVAAVLFGFPGLIGNSLFYRHCRRDIERAIQMSPTLEEACKRLATQASTRARLMRIAMANLCALAVTTVLVFSLMHRATKPENTEDTAPVTLRRPTSTVNLASPVEAASAAALQALPPLASASAPTSVSMAGVTPNSSPTDFERQPTEHFINVGLFADPDNARRAYVKLVKAGLPAQREVIVMHQQKMTRVRSGSYASRREAQAEISRIKAIGLDAVLAKP